jgi:hypothetical protein
MAGKIGLDLKSFRGLAKDWTDWRDTLTDAPESAPGYDLLRAATEDRVTWELLLSSLAYVLVGPKSVLEGYVPEIALQERITRLVYELAETQGDAPDGFSYIAYQVGGSSYPDLMKVAPHFAGVLESTTPSSFSGALLYLYCRNKYPNGGSDYQQCLITGA